MLFELIQPKSYLPLVIGEEVCTSCFQPLNQVDSAPICFQCLRFPLCAQCLEFYTEVLRSSYECENELLSNCLIRCPICRGKRLFRSLPLAVHTILESQCKEVFETHITEFQRISRFPDSKGTHFFDEFFVGSPPNFDVILALTSLLSSTKRYFLALSFYSLSHYCSLSDLLSYYSSLGIIVPTSVSLVFEKILSGRYSAEDVFLREMPSLPRCVAAKTLAGPLFDLDISSLSGSNLCYALSSIDDPCHYDIDACWMRILGDSRFPYDLTLLVPHLARIPHPSSLSIIDNLLLHLLRSYCSDIDAISQLKQLIQLLLSLTLFPFNHLTFSTFSAMGKKILFDYFLTHFDFYSSRLSSKQFELVIQTGIRLGLLSSSQVVLQRHVELVEAGQDITTEIFGGIISLFEHHEEPLNPIKFLVNSLRSLGFKFSNLFLSHPRSTYPLLKLISFSPSTHQDFIDVFLDVIPIDLFTEWILLFQRNVFCRVLFSSEKAPFLALLYRLFLVCFPGGAALSRLLALMEDSKIPFSRLFKNQFTPKYFPSIVIGNVPQSFFFVPGSEIWGSRESSLQYLLHNDFSLCLDVHSIGPILELAPIFSTLPEICRTFLRSALMDLLLSEDLLHFSAFYRFCPHIFPTQLLCSVVIQHFDRFVFDDRTAFLGLAAEYFPRLFMSLSFSHQDLVSILDVAHPAAVAPFILLLLSRGWPIEAVLSSDRLAAALDVLPLHLLSRLLEIVISSGLRDLCLESLTSGTTLLHIAARRDLFDWVSHLVSVGVDFLATDCHGRSVLDVAMGECNTFLQELQSKSVPHPVQSDRCVKESELLFVPANALPTSCFISPPLEPHIMSQDEFSDLDESDIEVFEDFELDY